MKSFTLLSIITLLSISSSFASDAVEYSYGHMQVLSNGNIQIQSPQAKMNAHDFLISSESDFNGICKIYNLGAYIKKSALKIASEKPTVKVSWSGGFQKFGKNIGFLYPEYYSIQSLTCSTLDDSKKLDSPLNVLERAIRGTEISQADLNPMPNIQEDSKTGDYFGFHCHLNQDDGGCKNVQAFYYSKADSRYYLYGKTMNSEYINYLEFKKGWNWSNRTNKISHSQFLSTLERFTKL